jgi:hypothetical protein
VRFDGLQVFLPFGELTSDQVSDVVGRVAGEMDHFGLDVSDLEDFVIVE